MSFKNTNSDRPVIKPAILTRKRKAEKELEMHSPESSPVTSPASCDQANSSDCEMSVDENSSPVHTGARCFRSLTQVPLGASSRRFCPLPELDWAEQKLLWHSMVVKDDLYPRDHRLMERHPDLEPRMRAILLDWLTEVSEVYRLHRMTYYLAVDYIDRFLTYKPNLPSNLLQLLGTTALFVAAKMEEIYPPQLNQFAYVTDGACTEADILKQELILLMTLNWSLSPMTVNGWLNIFMQMAFVENDENLVGPEKFPKSLFVQICQVLDLCILDTESLRFRYSVLCASAIAHLISKETAMHVSGLSWSELLPCANWLRPFVEVVAESGGPEAKYFSDVISDDWHNIQAHTSCLRLLDQVQEKQRKMRIAAANEYSPSAVLRELTPPQSGKKARMSSRMHT